MKKEFLMGEADGLKRRLVRSWRPRELSRGLEKRLLTRAATQAVDYFSEVFEKEYDEKCVDAVYKAFNGALSIGLFRLGGIQENDFLMLRALAEVMKPTHYIESGVFVGSSLYAFHSCSSVKHIWAIDPDLTHLKFTDEISNRTQYIDSHDFGEIQFGDLPENTVAYFDDHINTMSRIEQSAKKGIKILVFDDSVGFHGISQRIYPSIPSIGMLNAYEDLRVGDEITWYVAPRARVTSAAGTIRRGLSLLRPMFQRTTKISMTVSEGMLEQMGLVRDLVRKIVPLPNLLETVPLRDNEPAIEQTKYLVLLK
jgi:hypothetical protein